MTRSESDHDAVFGSTFARYSGPELEEFIAPFELRLRANGIAPGTLFSDARVLDAGCGGGRGSLFALRHGAAFVHCLDVSEQNVATTARVLERAGYDNFAARRGSLEHIPFDDEFDVVWCNGVLMHTAVPSATLTEVVRVLRPGGRAWIYVYGSGGIYWRTMAVFRRAFAALAPDDLIETLDAAGLPTGRVAEMLDDWKAPFLRTYKDDDIRTSLEHLGCSSERLLRGMPYDTSEQLAAGVSPGFVGEGDLRYLVTKSSETVGVIPSELSLVLNASHLDEDRSPLDDPETESRFAAATSTFSESAARNPAGAIATAARTQLFLRDSFLPSPSAETLEGVIARLAGQTPTP